MPPGITVGRTPLDVAGILQELLYSRGRPVVFTSATLADHRGFGFVRSRFGLDDRGTELKLDSPFDFERQALLYVPDAGPEPNDAGFLDGVFEQLQALLEITGGGALVLFTSYKNQRAVAQRLRAAGAADLLVQGEAPRAVLIDRLRERRDAVLLATASFWQGVDVAGEALRLVVIDKLPFDSPGDPVVAARIERFKRGGGDAFREFQVPTAALALRQGFGRLIRSRTDRGLVAILDRRLRGKWYGRAFLQALPKCGLTASLDEAREWWRGGTPTRKKKRGAGAPPGPSQ